MATNESIKPGSLSALSGPEVDAIIAKAHEPNLFPALPEGNLPVDENNGQILPAGTIFDATEAFAIKLVEEVA